jgi:hypothetical protein
LFVGGNVIAGRYPEADVSAILLNDGKGNFSDVTDRFAPDLKAIGIVTDAMWLDLNNDKRLDLAVVGEWMPVTLYINKNGKLVNESTLIVGDTKGWWQSIAAEDFDGDGDLDLIAGNFGMNNQFKATSGRPVSMYFDDFDGNGSVDPLMSYYIGDKRYPAATRDELTEQLPSFKKKFPDYASYVSATVEDILSKEVYAKTRNVSATTFMTAYWQNDNGHFTMKTLPVEIQFAPVTAIQVSDVNGDGHPDFIAGGNLSGARARFGKATASYGNVFLGDGHGNFQYILNRESGLCIRGDIKHILRDKQRFYFAVNNSSLMVYTLK